jgi:hypothetical protein
MHSMRGRAALQSCASEGGTAITSPQFGRQQLGCRRGGINLLLAAAGRCCPLPSGLLPPAPWLAAAWPRV